MSADLSAADASRQAELTRMKLVAIGFLLAATAVFIAFRFIGDDGWKGYVETAAEAAMVGGIADWFAVTALFRHPLGLAIPHTAIIPTRKNEIGASLGRFVEDNFLDGDLLAERVSAMALGDRLATWLGDDRNAASVSARIADGLVAATELLDDEAVQETMAAFVRSRLERTSAAPVLARALDAAVESSQHQAALDAVLRSLDRTIDDNAAIFRAKLHSESPWWVPEALDDRVYTKLVAGLRSFLADVQGDPRHELRHHLTHRMGELANRLRTDPDLQARVDSVRDELLDRPELQSWLEQIWLDIEIDLASASADPDSPFHRRIRSTVDHGAERLNADEDLRNRIDGYAGRLARYAAKTSGNEVSDLIAGTVERWDADDTGRRIELQIGRDLQYIRINGTVVGGLVGVVIHAVAQVIG